MFELSTNNIGGYATNATQSSYDGIFFYENQKMMKIAQEISNFYLAPGSNCILFDAKKLILDIRESYSSPIWGREYGITKENDIIIIRYTKKNQEKTEYTCFVAIQLESEYEIVGNFVEAYYPYDERRGDDPKRYVYHALNTNGTIKLSFSFDKNKAISQLKGFKGTKLTNGKDTLKLSINALNSLVCNIDNLKGIYAGLPWFFQFWARDELISLVGLMKQQSSNNNNNNNNEDIKNILIKYLNSILDDGRIPNRVPEAKLGSADGIGWLYKRIYDYIYMHPQGFNNDELRFVKTCLEKSIFAILKNYSLNIYIKNNDNETWMDTSGGTSDTRAGVRIEIQAMQLNMYRLHKELCQRFEDSAGEKMSFELEKNLKRKLRKDFWNGDYLADGLDDFTARPNVFLAYYIYPELMNKNEWKICFDNLIKKLWLEWGGLSTIAKDHPHYMPYHSGKDNRSYHRGDSWFWVNNLAAICLARLDKKKYRTYIEKIKQASENDILNFGYRGYHSEISSAEKQEPFGCYAQAWSSAMFIELLDEYK